MPTGYTAALVEMNYNVREWLLTSLVRNMGVCVQLRDERHSLSYNAIRIKLVEAVKYSSDRLSDIAKEEAEFIVKKQQTEAQWKTEWAEEVSRCKRDNEKRVAKYLQEKTAHQIALEKLRILARSTKGEVLSGACAFGIEQLTLVIKGEYAHPYTESWEADWESYRRKVLQDDERTIQYHRKDRNEQHEREISRLKAFDAFVEEVKAIDLDALLCG